MQERRQDRPRQLDSGRLYRAALQGTWQVPAAAGRFKVTGAVGLEDAHHGDVRSGSTFDEVRVTQFRVPLPIARAFRGSLQDLLRADAQSLCRLDEANQQGLRKDLLALIGRMNRAEDGTMVVRASISRS